MWNIYKVIKTLKNMQKWTKNIILNIVSHMVLDFPTCHGPTHQYSWHNGTEQFSNRIPGVGSRQRLGSAGPVNE